MPIALGEWHTMEITGTGPRLDVYLNGAHVLGATDTDQPHLSGTVAFESFADAQLTVDDVVLRGLPPSGPTWVATGGPRGGIGYDVRIHPTKPNILWVTDATAGVHKSTDGGRTWVPRNEGITARAGGAGDAIPIFSLNLDPRDPDTLWAGTTGQRGVFKSTDGGANWVQMVQGIVTQPAMEFRSFTVDPTDSNTAYCGGNYLADPATLRQRGFIYKTTDGGKSWKLLIEPGALVRWIIVDPSDPRVIYAATGIFDRFAMKPEGVLKSLDGGSTWTHANNGLQSLVVGALVMHPTDPRILLAGCGKIGFLDEPSDSMGGIFKTVDGGQHWRKVDPFVNQDSTQVTALAFSPSNPLIAYADWGGIFIRSSDGGESWEYFEPDAGGEFRGTPISLAVHPDDPGTIFMNAYGGGVFVSTDSGSTWADSSLGYSGASVWDVTVAPSSTNRVLAASKNGVYLSEGVGQKWQVRAALMVDENLSVAISPADSSTWLSGRLIDARIWRTTDAGASWETVLPPLGTDNMFGGRRSVHRIAFAPSAPDLVFAATGIAPGYVAPDTVGTGVYVSGDNGRTWAASNRGLEGTRLNVMSVAVHPRDARVAYIGLLGDGVYMTADGGANWTPARQGLLATDIRALAIDPFTPTTIYAGAERGGVWRSKDAGTTWKQASNGVPAEASVRSLVADATHAGVVYACDLSSGVYRSTDGGTSWAGINNGLRNRAVDSLALTRDGLHLYAATDGAGVFRLDVPDTRVVRRRLRTW
jgi:photosystem II stability/assembly factor-like uncharacterized protein